MEKKTNDQERAKYDRLILENEQLIDELNNENRKIAESIHSLEEDLHRGFRKLNNLDNQNSRFGGSNTSWLHRNNEEQERAFRQLLRESNERIAAAYKKETKKIDEERELLYKKRSDISWD
ncbi:hypothetical protein [Enterococcus sp. AZ109]|uniref:hypothetical protein n=1 Tax=Enterococcus sp. AZ109 TaxID=2774634 RepID=UPI003F26C12E